MGFMDKLNDLAKKAQDKIQEVAGKATAPKVATASAPVQDWYYTIDGKTKHGPFSLDQLKKLAEAGTLQPSHMVRQEGATKWVAAGQVEALWTNHAPATLEPEPVARPPAQAGPPPLPANPDEKWYYAANGQQAGPVPIIQLKELIRVGQLLPTDMVWKEGMAAWAAAGSITDLFPRTSQPPPLPPAVVPPAMPSKVTSNRVTCDLDLPGQDGPHQVELLLDGEKIAMGRWQAGIHNLQFESAIGSHSFTLQLTATVFGASRTGKKEYPVQFKKPGHYSLRFKYGWMPMQLPTGIETNYSPHALEVIPMSEVRRKAFLGSWQPITKANEWLEFTKDGAVVFSDGAAGRVTISGSQPNEVIEIEMVNGQSRQFKVVSLTSDQLVIAEGNEATTFCRPTKPTATKREQSAATPSEVQELAVSIDDAVESTPTSSSKGFFGGLFSIFTNWKCPKCAERSGEKVNEEWLETKQTVASKFDTDTQMMRQVVYNVAWIRLDLKCKSCGHTWSEKKMEKRKA